MDFAEIGRDGVDWIYCVQNRALAGECGWVRAVMSTVLRLSCAKVMDRMLSI